MFDSWVASWWIIVVELFSVVMANKATVGSGPTGAALVMLFGSVWRRAARWAQSALAVAAGLLIAAAGAASHLLEHPGLLVLVFSVLCAALGWAALLSGDDDTKAALLAKASSLAAPAGALAGSGVRLKFSNARRRTNDLSATGSAYPPWWSASPAMPARSSSDMIGCCLRIAS